MKTENYIDNKIKSLLKDLKEASKSYNPNLKALENVFDDIKINVTDLTLKGLELTAKVNFYRDIKLFKKLKSDSNYLDITALFRLKFTSNYSKINYAENFIHDNYSDFYMSEIREFTKYLKSDILKEEKERLKVIEEKKQTVIEYENYNE